MNKEIEEIMKEFDAEFYESHNWEEVNDHIEEALLSARTELIKEIRDKMPKKQKDNLPDEIGGHKIDMEGFETFHRGFNSYHDELELILTKIDDEKHEK